MSVADEQYPNLAKMGVATSESLPAAMAATSESIQLVDQQVQQISYAHIQGGFQGADDMITALAAMQSTASKWPGVKSEVEGAAKLTVDAGPTAADIGTSASESAADLAAELQKFSDVVLKNVDTAYASAEAAFNAFSEGMSKAYSDSVNANAAASAAITRQQVQIESDIKSLQAKVDDLKSAGSIILGILTLGATTIAQIEKLQGQEASLHSEEARHQHELQLYQASLASFKNAANATKLASYALDSVQNALQQATNSVNDMVANSSTNLTVMQAYVSQFKAQYAGAVSNAQKLIG